MDNIIEVDNITKTFELSKRDKKLTGEKYKVAVDDISFKVKKGEIYALLGPNGAGKTTTMRCLSTLISPSKGTIKINGTENKEEIRKFISFLTSDLSLDKHFTPDYLFDYFSSLYGIKDNSSLKEELFSLFGICEFRNVKIGELSTGMRQKTSIVISLVNDPLILIYDEPTNGLDCILTKEVVDYLRVLKNRGKTIIISTHILDIINKLADNLAIINYGQMIFDGSIQELKEKTNKDNLEDAFFQVLGGEDNAK